LPIEDLRKPVLLLPYLSVVLQSSRHIRLRQIGDWLFLDDHLV